MRTIALSALVLMLLPVVPAPAQTSTLQNAEAVAEGAIMDPTNGAEVGPVDRSANGSDTGLVHPLVYFLDDEGVPVQIEPFEVTAIEMERGLLRSSRTVVRLNGSGSRNRFEKGQALYLRTVPEGHAGATDVLMGMTMPEFKLVRMDVKLDRRELETAISNCYIRRTGIAPERIQQITTEIQAPGLSKLTPGELSPGEYCILNRSSSAPTCDTYLVFDFSIQ